MAFEEALVRSEDNHAHNSQVQDQPSEQQNPLFSIIVPVLNMEQTISRTLDSIIDHSHDRVEIIVVDGQSGDGTVEQINPYRNEFAALISEPASTMRPTRLEPCNGEIVAILNGDDYYSHNEVLATYADKFENEDTGIVFGDLEFFLSGKPTRTIRTYSSRNFNPKMLRRGWMPPT